MNPQMIEKMLAAEAAHREGLFKDCEALCLDLLKTDYNCLPPLVLLGILKTKATDNGPAIDWLNRALKVDPECFEALLWKGIALRQMGRTTEAISPLRLAIRVNPGNFGALLTLGQVLIELQKSDKAIQSLSEAISVRPSESAPHHFLAMAYQQIGAADLAAREFERAAELDPTALPSLINLAQVNLELGRREEAARAFNLAYEREPDTARGLIQRARAQREMGQPDEAEVSLKQALEKEPNSVDALEHASNLMQQLGRFEEARVRLDHALTIEPTRTRIAFNRVYCRKVTSAESELLENLQSRLKEKLAPYDLRYVLYALGKAYDDLGETAKAMEYYEQANRTMRELGGNKKFDRTAHTREFNRKIKTFSPDFYLQNAALADTSDIPVFIVGMIRSGTTLVEQILSSHSQIVGGGELPFWMLRGHPLTADFSKETVRPVQRDYLLTLEGLVGSALKVTDKMPHNYMHLGAILAAFPNARIVHTRRNPIDNCLSIFLTPYQAPLDFGHDRDDIAFVYREYRRLMAHWRATLPEDRFIEVDYETLTADPEPSVRRLIEFNGLEWEESCLRPEDNQRIVKTPSMWQVRQPVYRSSVERWRKYLPWLGSLADLSDLA